MLTLKQRIHSIYSITMTVIGLVGEGMEDLGEWFVQKEHLMDSVYINLRTIRPSISSSSIFQIHLHIQSKK